MSLEQALETFFAESRELLDNVEELLLQIEAEPQDEESLNALFRAVHTVKGSAGLFGLDGIVAFAHRVENMLALVRSGHLPADADMVGLVLRCRDHLSNGIEAAAAGEAPDLLSDDTGKELAQAIEARISCQSGTSGSLPQILPEAEARAEPRKETADARRTWHLSLRFAPNTLRDGMDPASFIRYLSTLGEVVAIATLHDRFPAAEDFDPELCYLGFEIDLSSGTDRETIEQVFEFVREDSSIRILPPEAKIEEYLELIESLPEDRERLGEILVGSGAITRHELDAALARQQNSQAGKPPLGQILIDENATPEVLIGAALDKQHKIKERRAAESRHLRVDSDKLDALISRVGELVIAGASTSLLARREKDAALVEAASLLERLIEDIRDSALSLRMVEIGETFNRFRRVVRDVSRELGKEIELAISGADTELDKTVVEKISDPLLHLVRNAMDHGIEAPALRAERGKPALATLRLNAFHDSGSIVIEVADDGGGLDRQRILAKAIERGLVAPDQHLSEHDIDQLIFLPGFSTADAVTNLSGRGVGMDVVRKNITALRGSIDLHSEPGRGTTFRIRLPLTLAIIDGFLVSIAGAAFVLPLDMVVECLELSKAAGSETQLDYLDLRGTVLPLVRLRSMFHIDGEPATRESVVVVRYGESRAGLVVDRLHGELQTVIKPLGRLFRNLNAISGSTILGSGDVALIIDVPTLLRAAAGNENRCLSPQSPSP